MPLRLSPIRGWVAVSLRPSHEWNEGARLPSGTELATCVHCFVLRVAEGGRAHHWIRRKEDEALRIVTVEPPCIPQPENFRAPW